MQPRNPDLLATTADGLLYRAETDATTQETHTGGLLAVQAQRTKQTVPLLEAARRTVLLTGTPALSRPKEIFTQLHSLLPGRGIKFKAFAERYCVSERPDKWDPYKGACRG